MRTSFLGLLPAVCCVLFFLPPLLAEEEGEALVDPGIKQARSAVTMALAWLRDHQNRDGTWSCKNFMAACTKGACAGPGSTDDYDAGLTGLALLAFLGAGNSHKHGPFKKTVLEGVKALKGMQTEDGCFGKKSPEGHWIYNHAICTMAAAEAYGLSGKSELLLGMSQKAVDFLVGCQNPYMGWRYGSRPGDNDTSCTAWATMALKTADISGLSVPKETFDGALAWFDKVTDDVYYKTGYTSKGDSGARLQEALGKFEPSEAMTAAALTCRIFLLRDKAPKRADVQGAANLVRQSPPKWDVKAGTIDMYYWFWASNAMFQMGDEYWKLWEEPLRNALIPTQRRDGCETGSWDPVDAWGTAGGRVYATAMCALALESYSRFKRMTEEGK